MISERRVFLGRLAAAFLAALFCTCFASKEVTTPKGDETGTKADAVEARARVAAMIS